MVRILSLNAYLKELFPIFMTSHKTQACREEWEMKMRRKRLIILKISNQVSSTLFSRERPAINPSFSSNY